MVTNIGRAILNKIAIKFEGQEVSCLHDADVFHSYRDLWLTDKQKADRVYQGIETANQTKLRIAAGDASESKVGEVAVGKAWGSRYCIPLDFELLTRYTPTSQQYAKTGTVMTLDTLRPTSTNTLPQLWQYVVVC